MAEYLTIDLLYHYHMDNIHTCNITAHVKGGLVSAKFTRFPGPFIMEFIGFLSQNMLLRHENVHLEVQLPQNWRIVNILTIADVCQRVDA